MQQPLLGQGFILQQDNDPNISPSCARTSVQHSLQTETPSSWFELKAKQPTKVHIYGASAPDMGEDLISVVERSHDCVQLLHLPEEATLMSQRLEYVWV